MGRSPMDKDGFTLEQVTRRREENGDFSQSLAVAGVASGDLITATATDASGDTSEFSVNTAVVLKNLAPVLSVPTSQSIGENVPLVFSSADGNGITVFDVDSEGGIEQLSLAVNSGAISLGSTAGITFINGTTDGSRGCLPSPAQSPISTPRWPD